MSRFRPRSPRDTAEAEFFAQYGPWAEVSGIDVVSDLLAGLTISWWVAGGVAIDAFSGSVREHDDIDVGIFRCDADALRQSFGAGYQICSVGPSGIQRMEDGFALPDDADQIWIREDDSAPWILDILLTPGGGDHWISRRDPSVTIPLSEATWTDAAGVRYLAPELVLCFKAKYERPKDYVDFDRAWPSMGDDARRTVIDFLDQHHPEHRWLKVVRPVLESPVSREKP